jgi:CRP-like cAMP-binding protein
MESVHHADARALRNVPVRKPGHAAARTLMQRRLLQLKMLSHDDPELIDKIIGQRILAEQGSILLGKDKPSHRPHILLSGWACRQIVLVDGRRQIFGFQLPGDILAPDDGHGLLGNVVSLTPVITAPLPSPGEHDIFYADGTPFTLALDAAAGEHERLLQYHILRLGSMCAFERLAHLILEFCKRMANVGLFDGKTLPLPLSQEALADALGLSTVHINRTLKLLRDDNVIQYASRSLLLIDFEKLSRISFANGIAPTNVKVRDGASS